METPLRRHPRVPTSLPCALHNIASNSRVPARATSVATLGLGVEFQDVLEDGLDVGSPVSVNLALGTKVTSVKGSIAWLRRTSNKTCTIGIALSDDEESSPETFRTWVDLLFTHLRNESFELVAHLASDDVVHWQTLQTALDKQARDGGYLCDHLDGIQLRSQAS